MIATLVASALLQAMSQEQMIVEGEEIGRIAVAAGICLEFGYPVDDAGGEALADDFGDRAVRGGWAEPVVVSAVEAGSSLAMAELREPDLSPTMTDAELTAAATSFFDQIKAICRGLHAMAPSLLPNPEAGDRNVDARLAIMLRSLAE